VNVVSNPVTDENRPVAWSSETEPGHVDPFSEHKIASDTPEAAFKTTPNDRRTTVSLNFITLRFLYMDWRRVPFWLSASIYDTPSRQLPILRSAFFFGEPSFGSAKRQLSPVSLEQPPPSNPVATGKAAILPTIAPKSRLVRWLSAKRL
jgi:hypothetical protein